MTFQKLVDALGGPVKAARKIGVCERSIYRWLNGERTPRPHQARKIITLSKNKISYTQLLRKN